VGELGITSDFSVFPEVALGAGLGIGSGLDAPTPQVVAITRLRPFDGVNNAFVANLAYSTGGY
jgi:hypothetical protein